MDVDLDNGQRRELVALVEALIESMQPRHTSAAIFSPTPDELVSEMLTPPGENPSPTEHVLDRLGAAAQGGWDKHHGGDLAFIPSGGLYTSAVAAWLAAQSG